MKRVLTAALFASFAFAVTADTARAAPPGLDTRPVDLELREADVGNVFRLLAEVGKRDVVLDPCVVGTVDLKLHNAPVPLVFDVLATKLGLRYEQREGVIVVHCGSDRSAARPAVEASQDPRLERRVSVDLKEIAVQAILTEVAKSAGVKLVVEGDLSDKVSLTLANAKLSTVLAAVDDATGLTASVEGDELVVKRR